jgi:peptidyl-prolyl cis-trans isomerase A (cyclophilin A)
VKKAFPYLAVIGVALVALYAVYQFRTTRLLPQQLEDMRQATDRLAGAEQAEHDHDHADGDNHHDGETSPSQDSADASTQEVELNAYPPEQLPDEAPDQFQVAFECSNGIFVVECQRDWAPNGVARFYELVKMGFYDDIRVFRVVPGFVVQFGISNNPALNLEWMESTIPDDPVTQSNTRGKLTFAATGRPNSRSTQLFVNLTSSPQNTSLDERRFAPIGEVIYGMETVDGFYAGYQNDPTPYQQQIAETGNSFLDQRYPKLDSIKRAYIIESIEIPQKDAQDGGVAADEPANSDDAENPGTPGSE